MTGERSVRPLGELEAAIMEILWDDPAESRRVREVVDALHPERPLAYTTVMTVLDHLHRKGWVTRERDGRAWSYRASGSRESYAARLMSDALASSTDRAGALAQFAEQIDPEDAERLAAALAEALAQRRGEARP